MLKEKIIEIRERIPSIVELNQRWSNEILMVRILFSFSNFTDIILRLPSFDMYISKIANIKHFRYQLCKCFELQYLRNWAYTAGRTDGFRSLHVVWARFRESFGWWRTHGPELCTNSLSLSLSLSLKLFMHPLDSQSAVCILYRYPV